MPPDQAHDLLEEGTRGYSVRIESDNENRWHARRCYQPAQRCYLAVPCETAVINGHAGISGFHYCAQESR